MVFPIVMYGCKSWTIKNAECWRIDAFKLWCWRRLLRVPWTARSSNQSILKEISPAYSLEGLMLKLKLQYFGHLMQKNGLIGKYPDGGKDWRQEEKRTTEDSGWMASQTQWTRVWVNSGSWWYIGRPGMLQSMESQSFRHDWMTELNWTARCSTPGTELKPTSLYNLENLYILLSLQSLQYFLRTAAMSDCSPNVLT